jgi:hypothetical protein
MLRSVLRRCVQTLGFVTITAVTFVGGTVHAADIPPDQMFFIPSSLVTGTYPTIAVTDEAFGGPWTAVWTPATILAIDPGRINVQLTGIEILPVLKANPANPTSDGAYRQHEINAITIQNYQNYFHYTAGIDYTADLTNGVLTATIYGAGPWTFRVKTTSSPSPGAPIEHKSYVFTAMLNDMYLLPSGAPTPPWELQRVSRVGGIFQFDFLAGTEVHIVSKEPAGGDAALEGTKSILDDQGKPHSDGASVADTVAQICAAAAANGGAPVDVVLYGHGGGSSTAGSGRITLGGDCVGNGCGTTWCEFGNKLKGKVKSLTLTSCNIGNDAFSMQQLANYMGAPVSHYNCYVTVCTGGWFSDGYFNASATGVMKKSFGVIVVPPQAFDLDGSGMIDSNDLSELLSQWGGSGDADIDSSGVVDAEDLTALMNAWFEQN